MESKWWEYYAVRYFVGTVVGSVIVALLNSEPGSPFEGYLTVLDSSKEASFLGVGLLAALGFAFCYVGSAPVLTLHATRAHLRATSVKDSPYKFSLAVGASVLIAVLALWKFLPPEAAITSGLVIGLQIGLVLVALLTRLAAVEEFYRGLATVRAKGMPKKDDPPTPGSEYVTSYRHLREHGNAFLIVLLEGLLAYTLLHSPSRVCAGIVLLLWLLPAASVWIIGTVLEARLISKPLE